MPWSTRQYRPAGLLAWFWSSAWPSISSESESFSCSSCWCGFSACAGGCMPLPSSWALLSPPSAPWLPTGCVPNSEQNSEFLRSMLHLWHTYFRCYYGLPFLSVPNQMKTGMWESTGGGCWKRSGSTPAFLQEYAKELNDFRSYYRPPSSDYRILASCRKAAQPRVRL